MRKHFIHLETFWFSILAKLRATGCVVRCENIRSSMVHRYDGLQFDHFCMFALSLHNILTLFPGSLGGDERAWYSLFVHAHNHSKQPHGVTWVCTIVIFKNFVDVCNDYGDRVLCNLLVPCGSSRNAHQACNLSLELFCSEAEAGLPIY